MLDNIGDKFTTALQKITGTGKISEKNISDTIREIRIALLDADVALSVVKDFINKVKKDSIGTNVLSGLNPGQIFTKIVNDRLVELLGSNAQHINLNTQPPAIIMVAGLQGAGKTTTVAKLAKFLKEKEKKKIMLVSCDVSRPAAIEQLKVLNDKIGALFYQTNPKHKPTKIVHLAIEEAKKNYCDVLIIDTAGRVHIDQQMMSEIKDIHRVSDPIETLFVVDSMSGQDAVFVAKSFNNELPLTGIILTKTDGDARGGVALSVKSVTGIPIKFIGTSEDISGFENFNPVGMASRILGKGDIVSLVENISQNVDQKQILKQANKFKKGKSFNLNDLQQQMIQMEKMGGLESLISKLPAGMKLPSGVKSQAITSQNSKTIAIINSMTPKEKKYPALIKASRKIRIANGSGNQVQDVNRLLKQHLQMSRMMKKFKGKNPSNMPFFS